MTPESPDSESSEIAEEILGYFAENPSAQDTLEGVIEWWLLHRRIKSQVVKVQTALAELVEKGFIVELRAADSRARYALNRRRLDEIRDLLGERPRDAGKDSQDSVSESEI